MGYGNWKFIDVHSETGGSIVYRHLFDHIRPTETGDPDPEIPGAVHATEIEYVFGTLNSRNLPWREVDQRVSDLMSTYWTNFAKTGDPNGRGLPE
jgi:para-nitrobenzyl esterase